MIQRSGWLFAAASGAWENPCRFCLGRDRAIKALLRL